MGLSDEQQRQLEELLCGAALYLYPPALTTEQQAERQSIIDAGVEMFRNPAPNKWAQQAAKFHP